MPDQNRIAKTLRQTFISLRNRNYRLFYIGQTISNTGNWLTNVALPLLVLKITGSGLQVGILAACQFGPILLFSAWAGAVADRSDKLKGLFITQSLEMAQSVGLAVLAFMPHPPLLGLDILAVVGGTLLAFDNPLRRSFVTEMVQPDDLPNAVILYSTLVNMTRAFGPALAGLLIITLGYGWAFSIDAVSYLAVIACLAMMRPAELFRRERGSRGKNDVRDGIKYILNTPFLWISFGMMALIGTLSYNFGVTLPLFVTKALHGSTSVFTILYSILSIGSVVCALLIANRKISELRYNILGAMGLGLTMLLFGVVPNFALAIPTAFLIGMSSMIYLTASTTLIQIQAKSEMHGRILALQFIFLAGTSVIGGPLLGWLADFAGGRAPIIFGGAVGLLAAVFGFYASRRRELA